MLSQAQQTVLRDVMSADGPWVQPVGHPKTLQSLIDRELLSQRETKKHGRQIKITAKGRKALAN